MTHESAQNYPIKRFLAAIALCFSTASMSAEFSWPAPGVMVNIGDHSLHIQCSGKGSPTVILDAGLGGNSLSWIKVEPEIARFTRVCAYDRAGYGWSERGPLPRTSSAMARELSQLLENGTESGPYIIVGHSLGGLNARLFANQFPAQVAGLVLVDATHEDQFERFAEAEINRPSAPTGRRFYVSNATIIPSGLPKAVQKLAASLARAPTAQLTMRDELMNMRLSANLAAGHASLPDVPMAVVSHNSISRAESESAKRKAEVWMKMQRELATRTSDASFILVENSGHDVQLDQPEIVVDAIKQVVDTVRTAPMNASL